MKPYKKNRFRGYKPVVEITHHPKKGWSIHISNPEAFASYNFLGYIYTILHEMNHPDIWQEHFYDTASPEDRKKLNKI